MARLNKKVLVLVDESGTPGEPDFMLGAVAIAARDVAVAGSALAELRPGNAGEMHAVDMEGHVARTVLKKLRPVLDQRSMVLVNKASAHHRGARPEVYAAAAIEITKVAVRRYAALEQIRQIGNVELILDRTETNTVAICQEALSRAQEEDGLFKAVAHIAAVDSCAVPFLQVADLTAYSRRWVNGQEITAKRLQDECGIELL